MTQKDCKVIVTRGTPRGATEHGRPEVARAQGGTRSRKRLAPEIDEGRTLRSTSE